VELVSQLVYLVMAIHGYPNVEKGMYIKHIHIHRKHSISMYACVCVQRVCAQGHSSKIVWCVKGAVDKLRRQLLR